MPRLAPEQIEKPVAHYDGIHSMREVAYEFKLDQSTVRRHLRQSGITVSGTHLMKKDQNEFAKKLFLLAFQYLYWQAVEV